MNDQIISQILWNTKAVQINFEMSFQLVSGNYSPIYIDCRRLISDPYAMRIITASFCEIIHEKDLKADIIAGGESAGIPFAAFLAKELNKPMVYVRKKTKKYGTESLVEGSPGKNNWIILVEDLITDGQSKVRFIKSLKESGNRIQHCLVIFDRQQDGVVTLSKEGVELWSLCNLYQLMIWLDTSRRITKEEIKSLRNYFEDPKVWNLKIGACWMER